MSKPKPEYWYCCVGPARQSELTNGADGPMRVAVTRAFDGVTGRWPEHCYSGWGVTAEDVDAAMFATWPEEEKRDIVLSYMKPRSRKMPRHIKAWQLLLKAEGTLV